MDTLTDRYIWAVTRRLPRARRSIVGERLREQIEADVAAKGAAGTDRAEAETEVLAGLGDPDRRLAELEGRPSYLIGPGWYHAYRRLLIVVLSAVGPSVFGALLLVQALAGEDLWRAAPEAITVAFTVSVQVGFWITVAFAVIDRVSHGRRATSADWDVSELPAIPTSRVGLGETVVAVLAYLLLIGLVFWQRNIWVVETAGGEPVPLLDPALWDFWIPWFIGIAVLEVGFALAAFGVGRWTWSLAWVNLALGLAFAVPAVWVISSGTLVSAEFRATFSAAEPLMDALLTILPVVVVVVAAVDAVGGFRKAFRGSARRERQQDAAAGPAHAGPPVSSA